MRQAGWLHAEIRSAPGATDALRALGEEGGYASLEVEARLLLLRGLCDACVATDALRESLRQVGEWGAPPSRPPPRCKIT